MFGVRLVYYKLDSLKKDTKKKVKLSQTGDHTSPFVKIYTIDDLSPFFH